MNRRTLYVGYAAFLALGYTQVGSSDWVSSAAFHTAMELVATSLALGVGAMSLFRFYSQTDSEFLLLGVAFTGTALFDGYHAVVTSAYFAPMMPSDLPHLIPWSWVASRFFLAFMLVVTLWAITTISSERASARGFQLSVFLSSLAFFAACALFFILAPLPAAYYPELFFHRPQELLPAALFAVALVGFYRLGRWQTDSFHHWLVLCLLTNAIGQLVYMAVSAQVFDYAFDAAHLLKKTSYICTYIGLLISMYEIFRRSEKDKISLKQEVQQRKEAERELVATRDQLIEAEKKLAVDSFIGGITHEINNPLMGIYGYFEYIKSNAGDAEAAKFAERGLAAAERIQSIAHRLLALSESSRQQPEPIDICARIQQIVDQHKPVMSEQSIQITLQMPAVSLPVCIGSGELEQILKELISNAVMAISDEGASGGRVTIKCEPGEHSHDITVSDNGPGIHPSISSRIFDPFFTTRPPGSGIGLGLSLAVRLAERAGGNLRLGTSGAEGADFILSLPDAFGASAGEENLGSNLI